MKPGVQPIINHLYAEIDGANGRLRAIDADIEIVRVVQVRDVPPPAAAPVPVTTPPSHPPIQGDAVACRECGELLTAAGCVPCHNCGTTSGGCS